MSWSRRLLFLTLLIALAVRLWGVSFGLPLASARPDETQIAGPAVGYLGGNLEPPFFQWPALFQYIVALSYVVFALVTRPFGGYATLAAFAESRRQSLTVFLLIPRVLVVVLAVATVWWVFNIGRRTFGAAVGHVAALFLALAFLHVRESHFGVTDVPMTALVVLAVLLTLRWQEVPSLGRALAAGLAAGLATATKYNAIVVCAAFVVAWIEQMTARGALDRARLRGLAVALPAYLAAVAAAFAAGAPYTLLRWDRFLADARTLLATMAAGHGIVVGQGWGYFLTAVLPAAVGVPILAAAVAGTAVVLVTRFRAAASVLAFPLVYYAVAGRSYSVFARYILPVVPFICLAAAWFVVWAAERLSERRPQWRDGLIATAAVLMVIPTARNTVLFDRLMSRTDNRVIVSRELRRIIPAGSTFYQSGESYGQAPLGLDGVAIDVHQRTFDRNADRFEPTEPDWVLLQRSPLRLYSAVPKTVERIVGERYELQRTFLAGDSRSRGRFYDQQDAFFLPLSGLDGLERPGPSFELYRRRD